MSKLLSPKGYSLLTIIILLAALGFLITIFMFTDAGKALGRLATGQSPMLPTRIVQTNPNTSKLESTLDYSIEFPSKYKVTKDQQPGITTLQNQDLGMGEIEINRTIAYEDSDLDAALKSQSINGDFDTEKLFIDGNEAMKGKRPINYIKTNPSYIYVILVKKAGANSWIYTISTKDINLLADLDQIAKSFKYIN